jgi:outer membrane protein assembly factor BamD (BamD/ComL family)
LVSKLARDSRFATSAGELHLKAAQGYAAQDSTEKALKLLRWMTDFYKLQKVSGQAYLEMGKIHQEKLGDLKKAKENYELASKENPTPQVMQEALARSGEISRFESFQQELALAPPDSSAPADTGKTKPPVKVLPSSTKSDSAKLAESWYLLAEVYRLSLKKPDSALWAYETIFEKFANTPVAPKAMLAWGHLKESAFGDSAGAQLMYRQLLSAHPHSDFAREALDRLRLLGTPADTGYAEAVFREAEHLLDAGQINSAKAILSQIPERFPASDYAPKSLLTLAFLYEAHANESSDSAAFLAYQNVLRKYPESEYARKAKEKVGLLPPETKKPDSLAIQMPIEKLADSTRKSDSLTQAALDSLKQYDRIRSELAPPVRKDGLFVYPAAEYDSRIRTKLVFRVLLDFQGRVQRAELQNPTERDVINQEAIRAVQQTEFDMNRVDPGKINTYFIYELLIVPPGADPNAPDPIQ